MSYSAPAVRGTVAFDTEVYCDYFLCSFKNIATGVTRHFEMFDGHPFDENVMSILKGWRLISFNGKRFDMPLLMLACRGHDNATIKAACDAIIVEGLNHWDDEFKARFPDAEHYMRDYDHIDLFSIPPGKASLKIYGGKIHAPRIQDLPIEPSASISPDDRELLKSYCVNDLDTTILFYHYLKPQIDLRSKMSDQYGIDLRSKSDAQIAEAVIKGKVRMMTGREIAAPVIKHGTLFRYQMPEWIVFDTPTLQHTLAVIRETDFYVEATGSVAIPETLAKLDIAIGRSKYRMGIGGLHSQEKRVVHQAQGCVLIDRDVASYYPAIIMMLGLYPVQLGVEFSEVYAAIVCDRLAAKARGDKVTAEMLKITINGSFGKFGNKYSTLYSPWLLVQTTITGQLCLLMLIEMLEQVGVAVVSANTDGIVIKCPIDKQRDMDAVVKAWEMYTGFVTEGTEYEALYSRDVNNYVAVKKGGGVKRKGEYAPPVMVGSSWPNPANEVCSEAICALLEHGTPIEDTIAQCDDVRKFVNIRKVAGGAVKDDQYLGKAVRWYYAQGMTGVIRYKSNGNTVAKTEGAKPLMQLDGTRVPDDLDLRWYIRETQSMLRDLGYVSLV